MESNINKQENIDQAVEDEYFDKITFHSLKILSIVQLAIVE